MRAIALVLSVVLLGCGAAKPAGSLEQIDSMISSDMAEKARKAAPEAWSEGLRYLNLAVKAAEERDRDRSDRFAHLGLIQIKIAFADAQRVAASRRVEVAKDRLRKVDSEIERLRSLLGSVE